ncbi:sugar kinase [Halieaceae bacterium IMCC14734]|uniref:Sugar kinase n=2 Tax=Candidatus Litorirhabdus singularis TaxID=2518993 RepID=A0ABT3TCV8_9GAMM|nr:sugar kinase [Candidatus Litorirhabdus singularis]
MLEFSPAATSGRQSEQQYHLGVAGDTYNTAVALAQLGCQCQYLTALGQDPHSDFIIERTRSWGIDTDVIQRRVQQIPGLYLIDNDDSGERYFSYWRSQSAARACLSDPASLQQLLSSMAPAQWFYLSGISLALCGPESLSTLVAWLPTYRERGGKVIYDSNYRAALWETPAEAAAAQQQVIEHVDIYLPGVEDELILRGLSDKLALTSELRSLSQMEIVLKDGGNQMLLFEQGSEQKLTPTRVTTVIDTTGAGDAFNGGYLAARLRGLDLAAAASFASEVAAQTIAHRGAVLPAELWRPLRERLESILSTVS